MEEILKNSNKIIIDKAAEGQSGVLPYLPLPNLLRGPPPAAAPPAPATAARRPPSHRRRRAIDGAAAMNQPHPRRSSASC